MGNSIQILEKDLDLVIGGLNPTLRWWIQFGCEFAGTGLGVLVGMCVKIVLSGKYAHKQIFGQSYGDIAQWGSTTLCALYGNRLGRQLGIYILKQLG